jgi:putative isomerase
VFDWDNIFASLLAGIGNKTIAYSNLIQVIKSKTAAGFVPNYAAGGSKSMDRTEPPIGAKTLLQLYQKYKDK